LKTAFVGIFQAVLLAKNPDNIEAIFESRLESFQALSCGPAVPHIWSLFLEDFSASGRYPASV
jgi:hypothetical protein